MLSINFINKINIIALNKIANIFSELSSIKQKHKRILSIIKKDLSKAKKSELPFISLLRMQKNNIFASTTQTDFLQDENSFILPPKNWAQILFGN
ncbi:hypothetical protein [Chryseobacterium sp. KBW03]|uniref:hypothetical protein n=1 Tax=Chryseobacterium sp. KBW03 TaxID=2153362 RepID=UPI00162AE95A|nr:hypothetical protein [Chryseobacterium sp. KBW03]